MFEFIKNYFRKNNNNNDTANKFVDSKESVKEFDDIPSNVKIFYITELEKEIKELRQEKEYLVQQLIKVKAEIVKNVENN